jgi:hypothetical protein
VRFRAALVLVAVATLVAGCSDDSEPEVVRAPQASTAPPAYDATLEPAAAVMAIVPRDAVVLEVTDFDEVRLSLGYGALSSKSDPAVLRRFWAEAEREAPLLSRGMFRSARAGTRLGFTQDDVSWEAHFSSPSGAGYVVKFRDDLDMDAVRRAARSPSSPIAGATVVLGAHIAASGATREPDESWAAEPELTRLVGPKAGATYVSRECLRLDEAFGSDVTGDLAPTPAADLASLQELGPFAVSFGGTLATARLGPGRHDAFDRARLAGTLPATDPDVATGFSVPVADPSGGRIGFRLGNGPVAARLAHERLLPFAVCGA